MVDGVLGLVIATIATTALTLAIEVTEASFARKHSLDPGLSKYEREDVLPSAGLNSSEHKKEFKDYLSSVNLYP